MNYANIKYCDIANGPGVRTTLFVSGCRLHCPNCFNEEAWDFEAGEPFTDEVAEKIMDSMDVPYVTGLTILGGEPMEPTPGTSWRPAARGTSATSRTGCSTRWTSSWTVPSCRTSTTSRCASAVPPTSGSSTCPPRSRRRATTWSGGRTSRSSPRTRCRLGRGAGTRRSRGRKRHSAAPQRKGCGNATLFEPEASFCRTSTEGVRERDTFRAGSVILPHLNYDSHAGGQV